MVRWVSSNNMPASQPCGRCGVEKGGSDTWRYSARRCPSVAGGREAKSFTLTMAPTKVHTALCQGCRVEPFIQGTAFVRLEMAEADPANLLKVYYLFYGFHQQWEHGPRSRVIQQRLVFLHKELVELQVESGA